MALPVDMTATSQWRIWQSTNFQLLDTPEKAVDLAEAIVRAAFGPEQAGAERPFVATDQGQVWQVQGERLGMRALGLIGASSIVTLDKKTGAILDYRLVGAPVRP